MTADNPSRLVPEEPLDISDSRRDSAHVPNNDLIAIIKEYADKLAADRATRGDLKIVSRALRELRWAFKVFTPYRNRRKVTVFGSARTQPEEPAYQQAIEFGRRMAESQWMVVTGAAQGIMEAGHVGAGRENSMGINILLPFEQDSNSIIAGDEKLVHMKYFFTRKLMFVKECDAVVCLPGGFGTMDEALEVLTLLQTGKRDLVPVVLLDQPGGNYWTAFEGFIKKHLVQGGMICDQDLSLYRVTDDVETAVTELCDFFSIYHSMRYVKDELVFRLQRKLPDRLIAEINSQFPDILESGQFRQCGALPDEKDEPDLANLPRLVFEFNRRDHGRLRQLVNLINHQGTDEAAADA